MSDPIRLDLAEDAPAQARDALKLARADAPSAARLAAIQAGVLAKLGPPPGGGGGGGGGGGAGTLAKAAGVAIAGGAAVTAIVLATRPPQPTVVAPMIDAAAPVAAVSTPPAPSSAEPATIAVGDLPSVASSAPRAVVFDAGAPVDPADAERAEVALLDAAQKSLASNPAATLQKCDEHARTFPKGTLVQEREVMAIDALLRLGRRADAEARAERFRRNFPRSGHLRRVDALLGAP
jgi:hypothetical protein